MGARDSSRTAYVVVLAALGALASAPACKPAAAPERAAGVTKVEVSEGDARVTAFAIAPESLNVDSIGMRDGLTRPDGNRDLVFTATVEGPLDALYLVNCSEKGEPLHGFRADTIFGHEELPRELGGVVDVGRLTVWIGIVKDGKFVNGDGGSVRLGPGPHVLRLYVPNTGTLNAGTHLRLYARGLSGALAGGPVVPY